VDAVKTEVDIRANKNTNKNEAEGKSCIETTKQEGKRVGVYSAHYVMCVHRRGIDSLDFFPQSRVAAEAPIATRRELISQK
jgi:hypothetical protein